MGNSGWSNGSADTIHPAELMLSAMAQLTQEDMQKKYVQTVIDAGTHEFMDNGKVSYIEVLTA